MSKKYYIRNMFWGYLMAASIIYFSFGSDDIKLIYLQIFGVFSGVLFPFARYLIENIALKYTDRELWNKGMFRDGVPKTYLITLYTLLTSFVAIPLGLICIVIELKKSRLKKNGF
ncbi:colicin E1 family microcin immunity protein [Klebsiella oxytoca]|uniref:colicin E1 family microcin immunity protein n=1 Tax=Klebsiella oxytoca TaxID=571 RepID=UPI00254DC1FC|nr:colicin E1 family microcin immunity protein [Klebsiella oxytoca]MEC5509945.1 colicin E1 family microcin immunity protein [Klebsiella oxytoca]